MWTRSQSHRRGSHEGSSRSNCIVIIPRGILRSVSSWAAGGCKLTHKAGWMRLRSTAIIAGMSSDLGKVSLELRMGCLRQDGITLRKR